MQTEYWLTGPVEGVNDYLQPVAHALLQARREVGETMNGVNDELLWQQPAGRASAGFHLQHLTGVLNRLLTYARGEMLTAQQLQYLKEEGKPAGNITCTTLVNAFENEVVAALDQLKNTPIETLTQPRAVGRKQLPTTVLGLLVHAAEHTMRHVGQLMVTVAVVKES